MTEEPNETEQTKNQVKLISICAIAATVFIVALGMSIHSCGTKVEATCPGGASISVKQDGQLGGEEAASGLCEKLEGKG